MSSLSDSSDSGPDDRLPPKKSKTQAESKKMPEAKRKLVAQDDEEDSKLPLGNNRFVSISVFRGKARVDIREYYVKDGEGLKPGKKGISLSFEQFNKLKELIPEIEEKIKNM